MSETSSRLLELLSLLQARRDWPGNELANRLEVSGRTIRRDMERLRRLGYPVESLTGPAGGDPPLARKPVPPPPPLEDQARPLALRPRPPGPPPRPRLREDPLRVLRQLP